MSKNLIDIPVIVEEVKRRVNSALMTKLTNLDNEIHDLVGKNLKKIIFLHMGIRDDWGRLELVQSEVSGYLSRRIQRAAEPVIDNLIATFDWNALAPQELHQLRLAVRRDYQKALLEKLTVSIRDRVDAEVKEQVNSIVETAVAGANLIELGDEAKAAEFELLQSLMKKYPNFSYHSVKSSTELLMSQETLATEKELATLKAAAQAAYEREELPNSSTISKSARGPRAKRV